MAFLVFSTTAVKALVKTYRFMLMLVDLLHENRPLFVFASFVLEPDPDDPRTKSRHLDQLFLHESVWPRIRPVAGPQRV